MKKIDVEANNHFYIILHKKFKIEVIGLKNIKKNMQYDYNHEAKNDFVMHT